MKTFLSQAMFALLIVSTSHSQIHEGYSRELSLSGGYQHTSREGSSSGSGVILISPRLGFFVHSGLEVEPELTLMAGTGFDVVYMINGNLCVNLPPGSNGVPFILAGYGISNTVPFFDVPSYKTDFVLGVLNLGAGIKIFIKEDVAVRLEYRFQNFSGSGDRVTDYPGYSSTPEADYTLHTIHFGFSVLF